MGNPDDSAAWAADDRRCKMRSATCVDVYCRQVYRVEGAQRERRDRGHRRRYRIHQETSARSLAAMPSGFAPLLACRARRFAGPSSWVAQPCPGPTKPSNPTTARWCCGATAPRVAVANPRCPQCTAKTTRTRAGSSWGGRVRACRTRTRTRRGRLGRRDSRHGRRPRRPPAGHCGPFPPAAPSPWPGARFSRWPPACPPWGTEQHDPISRARGWPPDRRRSFPARRTSCSPSRAAARRPSTTCACPGGTGVSGRPTARRRCGGGGGLAPARRRRRRMSG